MHSINYLKICSLTFGIGGLLVAMQQEWIVLRSPFAPSLTTAITAPNSSQKKLFSLYYWQNQRWNCEQRELIWHASLARDLKHLIANWLEFMISEQLIKHRITLQSALTADDQQTLYLSFDRELFSSEQTTREKLMIIEGLLKTLRDNQIPIMQVYFLLQQQVMLDLQLDFKDSWPIQGFI